MTAHLISMIAFTFLWRFAPVCPYKLIVAGLLANGQIRLLLKFSSTIPYKKANN
jgi:hypothetical protein